VAWFSLRLKVRGERFGTVANLVEKQKTSLVVVFVVVVVVGDDGLGLLVISNVGWSCLGDVAVLRFDV
jgi:hypothetical protein